MGSILDRYEAVLLDMNGTFMFGEDRFGPGQDYYRTYCELAGSRLTPSGVRSAIDDCICRMTALYDDPLRIDSFPQVREILVQSPACIDLPNAELDRLEAVIAQHELGRVPDLYATALRTLAATHRLGVVTNVWSRKPPWLQELRRACVLDLFAVVVISSDGPSIKPSPVLMRQALETLDVPLVSVLFAGDSLRCDIGGANAVGIDSVWINSMDAPHPPGAPAPTFQIHSLLELASVRRRARSSGRQGNDSCCQ